MRFIKKKKTRIDQFIDLLPELQAIEFLGLARVLKVKVMSDTEKDEKGRPLPRDSQTLIEEVLISFVQQSTTRQKEIIAIVKNCIKDRKSSEKKGGSNGTPTKNRKEEGLQS